MVSTQYSLNFELNARGFESEREKIFCQTKVLIGSVKWYGLTNGGWTSFPITNIKLEIFKKSFEFTNFQSDLENIFGLFVTKF